MKDKEFENYKKIADELNKQDVTGLMITQNILTMIISEKLQKLIKNE